MYESQTAGTALFVYLRGEREQSPQVSGFIYCYGPGSWATYTLHQHELAIGWGIFLGRARCLGRPCLAGLLALAPPLIVLLELLPAAPPPVVKVRDGVHPGAQLAEAHGQAILVHRPGSAAGVADAPAADVLLDAHGVVLRVADVAHGHGLVGRSVGTNGRSQRLRRLRSCWRLHDGQLKLPSRLAAGAGVGQVGWH